MSLDKQISEVGLKLQVDDFVREGERFRAFDQNFLPIELDHIKDSYQYILQVLTRKCNDAVKFHHLSNKYSDQINEELKEIAKILTEIEEFDRAQEREKETAFKFIQEISLISQSVFDNIRNFHEAPRDIELAFKGFLYLGPPGTNGGADVSWKAIKELLKNRENLTQIMTNLFETNRIEDISRPEIEKAEVEMRHLIKEFAVREPTCKAHPLARSLGLYVIAALSYWDMVEAKQARREIMQLKKERVESIKKELATYKEVINIYEKEIEEIFIKYKKGRQEFEGMKKESSRADEALAKFEEHYNELEKERNKDHRDVNRIRNLLNGLKQDCDQFDNIRVKLTYKLPGDTLVG